MEWGQMAAAHLTELYDAMIGIGYAPAKSRIRPLYHNVAL